MENFAYLLKYIIIGDASTNLIALLILKVLVNLAYYFSSYIINLNPIMMLLLVWNSDLRKFKSITKQ